MPGNDIATSPAPIIPDKAVVRRGRLPLIVRPASSQAGLASFRGGALRTAPLPHRIAPAVPPTDH